MREELKMHTKISIIVAGVLLLTGCSMKPELVMPKIELPSSNSQASELLKERWWEAFGDTTLNSVVDEAIRQNSDLEQAIIRVEQMRAAYNLKSAQEMPNLSATGGISKAQSSQNSSPYTGATSDDFSAGGLLNFEIDLFGKLRDARKSAKESLLAEEYNREAIYQAVIAQAINGYFAVVTLKKQESIAQDTLKSRLETLDYRAKQLEKGVVTELVLRQAESEMESTRAELSNIKNSLSQAKSALSVLLGRTPKEIFEVDISIKADGVKSIQIPQNLPSDILERRADIKKALHQVRASNFAVGSARAGYFPTISLTGSAGVKSDELDKLFMSESGVWGIGGNLLMPIFDFDRVGSQVDSAKEAQKLALAIYVQSVRGAFKDVRDALSGYEYLKERLVAQDRQIVALERTLELAQMRFDQGYSSYLEVLDAQRGLFSVKISQANSELALANATTALYKALGGGWKFQSKNVQ